jgi:hypothetical protein
MAEDAASFARGFFARAPDVLSPPSRPLGMRAMEFIDHAALIAIDGLVRTIRQMIDLKGIRESDRVLGITATNWRTGELRTFANSDLIDRIGHDVIQASVALPGIKPVPIDGEPYVDCGYLLNTPLGPAIDANGDELHVMFMDPDISNISVHRFDNVFDVVDKLYPITRASFFRKNTALTREINHGLDVLDQARLNQSQWHGVLALLGALLGRIRWPKGRRQTPFRQLVLHPYHPREDLDGALGLMNFERDHIAGLIARGYADAVAHDCAASGCVLPDGGAARAVQSPHTVAPGISIEAGSEGGMVHA